MALGLLHDTGVSRSVEHRHLFEDFEYHNTGEHCRKGHELLQACAPFACYATPVLYHHTPWHVLERLDLADQTVMTANLIHLADRLDVVRVQHHGTCILTARPEILAEVRGDATRQFVPRLRDILLDLAQTEAFWLAMEDEQYLDESLDLLPHAVHGEANWNDIKQIATLFAHVVDGKSPFTFDHSVRVAKIACSLAERLGFNATACTQLEIAALLHDLGKLRTPDEILDKPGPLTAEERAIMNRHAYDSYRILRLLFPTEKIALWAGCYHEKLSGQGAPFHYPAERLDIGTRIVAVADIWQALLQNRPYRPRPEQRSGPEPPRPHGRKRRHRRRRGRLDPTRARGVPGSGHERRGKLSMILTRAGSFLMSKVGLVSKADHTVGQAARILPTGRKVFFDHDDLIVSKTDPQGRITYVNHTFTRISGYTEQALRGQPHSIIRHPGVPRCMFNLLWDMIQRGENTFIYLLNMARTGDHYWVFSHIAPSFDAEGMIMGYHSHGRVPAPTALAWIIPLYVHLLAEEARHADPRQGTAAALTLLHNLLGRNGMTYDEFVRSL
ncbi:MAG: HD domain-containing protein [Rhodospirillaceae bacterium]|nr:MAG: HD domain-containing protein [Rhodospirillaceae bacterium]